jgi:hypothetical protein
MISPPARGTQRAVGKKMTWDKLPPFETGTENIDLSQMTEDPDVEGGYYCTVSVFNGTDEDGRSLSATFSIKAGKDENDVEYLGWSIEQGIRQDDGTYKVDGKSATLLLGADAKGDCEIIAQDGKTTLKKKVFVRLSLYVKCYDTDDNFLCYGKIVNNLSLTGQFSLSAKPFLTTAHSLSLAEGVVHDSSVSVYGAWAVYSHDGPWGMGPDGRFWYRWFFSEQENLTKTYKLTSTVKFGLDIIAGPFLGNRYNEYLVERVGADLILEGDPVQPSVSQPINSFYPGWEATISSVVTITGDYGPLIKNIYLNSSSYYYELESGASGGLAELDSILGLGAVATVTNRDDYYYITLTRPDGDSTANVYALFINESYATKEITDSTREPTSFVYCEKQVIADYSELYYTGQEEA